MVNNLTLVIPNKNDSKAISLNIKTVENYLITKFNNFEILIVTNGSDEESIKEINELVNNYPNCNQIVIDEPGKGRAVKMGLENAKFENILISDADFSVAIEELDKFIINNKFISPFIIGTRRELASQNLNSPFKRRFFGSIYLYFVKTLFGFSFTDTQCGFKYIDTNLFSQAKDITTNGFSFDLELILLATTFNIDIKEVPVTYIHNSDSSVNLFKDSIEMFFTAIKFYKKYKI